MSALFSIISGSDKLISSFVPLVWRISLWGLLAGVAAMAVYMCASDQGAIASLREEISEHRRGLQELSAESRSEYMMLAKKNLHASVALLGKVILPALLSALPVLVIASWMDAYHAYALPAGRSVVLSFIPSTIRSVVVSPPQLGRTQGGMVTIMPPLTHPATVSLLVNGKTIYSGDLFQTPESVIAKKSWVNLIFPSIAGYVKSGSPVEEIHLNLRKRRLFKGLPAWASGWEFPYFLGVLAAALPIKLFFRIG